MCENYLLLSACVHLASYVLFFISVFFIIEYIHILDLQKEADEAWREFENARLIFHEPSLHRAYFVPLNHVEAVLYGYITTNPKDKMRWKRWEIVHEKFKELKELGFDIEE